MSNDIKDSINLLKSFETNPSETITESTTDAKFCPMEQLRHIVIICGGDYDKLNAKIKEVISQHIKRINNIEGDIEMKVIVSGIMFEKVKMTIHVDAVDYNYIKDGEKHHGSIVDEYIIGNI